MNLILNLLVAVQMLAALAMIGLILIQHGKGADMGAAFGSGSAGSLFGASGSANFLSRTTAVLAAVFFVCTLLLAYFSHARPTGGGNSLLERAAVAAPAGAASAAIPVAPPAPSGASTIPGSAPSAQPAPAAAPATPAPVPAPVPAAAPASAPVSLMSAPTSTAMTPDSAPPQAEVESTVTAWAAAWSAKDADRYLGAYSADFEPTGKQTRKAWEAERRARLADKGDIAVNLRNLNVKTTGDTAVVKFDQNYKSTALSSSNRKTLELVRKDGKWLILREIVGG